jgi:hypothetical protein
MAKKYGPEKAESLLKRMVRHYTRMVYIQMPNASTVEADREYSKKTAARFDMRYEEMQGTSHLLKDMIEQNWDGNFVVVEPGQPITANHFLHIAEAAAAGAE